MRSAAPFLVAVLAAAPALAVAPPADPAKPKKPLVAIVLDGVKKVPGYEKVKAYETPVAPVADPAPEPTETKLVEVTETPEALVLQHPYLSPLLGAVVEGAKVPVKGVIHTRGASGCPQRLWYALDPFGYVCAKAVKRMTGAATTTQVLEPLPGSVLPFKYVMVMVKEGESIPMWTSLDDMKANAPPERQLERGDTVAVEKPQKIDGVSYWISVEGKVLPTEHTIQLGADVSRWHGEVLDDKTQFPFGWVTPDDGARVYAEASTKGKPVDRIARRTRVQVLEEQGQGGKRMLRIADGKWVRAADVNEVRKIARPDGITPATQWIDVDLGEQVLVAYEGEKPVYATLTSSGRAIPTPRGNYPVWAKVSSISMKSQPYEDKAYFVNKVPWVLFFQAHNAIHGAYWHDRFGVSKSHGCVNVAPLDAKHLFDWLAPPLPAGWTGYRAPDLLVSATVHVRNSHEKKELVQERPIGPPDKELEAQKMEEATARRAAMPPSPVAGPASPSP